MDPFSITAGAIGIAGVAATSIQQLRSLISGLTEAQDVLRDVKITLDNIVQPLSAISAIVTDDSTADMAKECLRKTGVADAVNACGDACSDFNKKLAKWTKHSTDKKLSLRDRLTVGLWNKEKMRTFRTRVQSCQTEVQFAVSITQLMVQLRSEKSSETHRSGVERQLQTLEFKIQEHLDSTKKQLQDAQARKVELEEDEDEEEDDAQRMLAIQEVKEQERLLEANQVSCGVMHSQVEALSRQDISNVETLDNSEAYVGMPSSVAGKIDQRIKDVRTVNGSRAVIGVFDGDFTPRGR
ncbi:unnamed protein product [Periconia digitata]|uniref:Azaphilone pigments biosynthesis cluster protein L N-terminal domain-containing protein n=1 Tax=Periconia digitata TaxID=1303443 RepID=A0A9W4UEW0_9PLEO|nr:unnamed protein product [Periconia digitata]